MVKQYQANEEVLFATPILINEQGEEIGGISHEFIVKLKPTTSLSALSYLAEQTKTKIVKRYEYDPHTYILAIDKNS